MIYTYLLHIFVICVKFNNVPVNENTFKKFLSSRYIEIDNYNFSHIDNINKAYDKC